MLCTSSDGSGTRNQPQNGFELVEGILEVHFLTNYFLGIGNAWISKFRNRFNQSSYLHHHLYIPNHNKILHILFLVRHRFLSTQFCLQFLKSYENVHQLNDVCNRSIQQEILSCFLHWNFDWKSCFVVFFLEWNEWKNTQFNFSSQNLSIECNFFKENIIWKKYLS